MLSPIAWIGIYACGGVFVPVVVVLLVLYIVAFRRTNKHEQNRRTGKLENLVAPHTEPVELYLSSTNIHCQKVRNALAEKRVTVKLHELDDPVNLDGKALANLLKINPNGQIPVLVHNGCPVVDADQILAYSDMHFEGPKLLPENEQTRALVCKWLQIGSEVPIPGPPAEDNRQTCTWPLGLVVDLLSRPVDLEVAGHTSFYTLLCCIFYHPYAFSYMNRLVHRLVSDIWHVLHSCRLAAHPPRIPPRNQLRVAFGCITEIFKDLESTLSDGRKFVSSESISLADVFLAANFNRLEQLGVLDALIKDHRNIREYWSRLKRRENFASCFRATAKVKGDKEFEKALHSWRNEVLPAGVVGAYRLAEDPEEEEEEEEEEGWQDEKED